MAEIVGYTVYDRQTGLYLDDLCDFSSLNQAHYYERGYVADFLCRAATKLRDEAARALYLADRYSEGHRTLAKDALGFLPESWEVVAVEVKIVGAASPRDFLLDQ